MTERESLLAAVIADPDDDGPRLVFADWLDEHGEADRAEFVRLQCELERLPTADMRRPGLERRAGLLLEANRAAWGGELGAIPPEEGGARRVRFRRGFVEGVAGTGTDLVAADWLFAREPITHVSLVDSLGEEVAGLRESAWLRRVRSLNCNLDGYFAQEFEYFLTSPLLAGLHEFEFTTGEEHLNVVPVLARATHLAALESLRLYESAYVHADDVATLASVPHLAGLRRLALDWGCLGDIRADPLRGLRSLLASPCWTRLTDLSLHARFGDAGLTILLAWPGLRGLTRLSLRSTGITDAGAAALAASPAVSGLTELDLSANYHLRDDGVRALLGSPHLAGLWRLALILPHRMDMSLRHAVERRFGAGVWVRY